ncbi:GNAT family N-acetyltransferase [Lachnospiraceae bacterium 45-P1]
MINIEIRPVTPDDLDAVTAVEAACFPAAEAATYESFRLRIAAFPESFFVAASGETIIGFINGCVTNERTIRDEMFEDSGLHIPDGIYQSIFGLDVLPEYRCRGIAADLMNHFIADARNKGRKGLILTCKDHLIPYYEKFGYRNLGVSASVHGGAVWYDMLLEFEEAVG